MSVFTVIAKISRARHRLDAPVELVAVNKLGPALPARQFAVPAL